MTSSEISSRRVRRQAAEEKPVRYPNAATIMGTLLILLHLASLALALTCL